MNREEIELICRANKLLKKNILEDKKEQALYVVDILIQGFENLILKEEKENEK